MNYTFCAQTDTGQQRESNEDSVVFDEALSLAVLADGMGGYLAGEIASSMATAVVLQEMRQKIQLAAPVAPSVARMRRFLRESVARANLAILSASLVNPDYAGMGTTLVACACLHETLLVGHIGDSRCYRWRNRQLQQLTRDHSWVQEQIDAGVITREDVLAGAIPVPRSLITRALGVEPEVELETLTSHIEPEDVYMLCSDGLTDMLEDELIARILELEPSACLDRIARNLVDAANMCGGRDNISVLLIRACDDLQTAQQPS